MEIILTMFIILSAKDTICAGEIVNCFSGKQDMSAIPELN